jgi:hypothetical protein
MIDAEKLAAYSSFSALIIGVTRYGTYHGLSQDRTQVQGGALPPSPRYPPGSHDPPDTP